MYGDLAQFAPKMDSNIMFHFLMILVDILGFIIFLAKVMLVLSFLNFKIMLNVSLVLKLKLFNLIRVESIIL
jgi:hypothetical protein